MAGFPTSALGWAWFASNVLGFWCVWVVAYRHNLTDYGDSKRSARRWAFALALIWPITVVAWVLFRRRFTTPLSH